MPEATAGSVDVAVAGGSIAGLCAGTALAAAGFDVHVFERAAGRLSSRGAGIVVQPELLGLLASVDAPKLAMTSCSIRRTVDGDTGQAHGAGMPQRFTSWEAIYRSLLSAFPDSRYHSASELTLSGCSDKGVTVSAGGASIEARLLIAADGIRSRFRARLAPDTVSRYAGYIAWRGVVDESALADDLVDYFDDTFSFCRTVGGGHALCYFIPGDELETRRGGRRLNWVWYVMADEGSVLDELLTDRLGRRRGTSVPQGEVSDVARGELLSRTDALTPPFAALVRATPDPFIQSIVDVAPPRMVYGRICLIGDAAFVVRPHTAAAASKAAADAAALARALRGADGDFEKGLSAWERQQTALGRRLVDYGVMLGERSRRAGVS